jgi:hypothetical protein
MRVIAENYGVKWPRALRNGMVIEVASGRHLGRWRVRSVKDSQNGVSLDMSAVDSLEKDIPGKKNDRLKREVRLATLIKDGLTIAKKGVLAAAKAS